MKPSHWLKVLLLLPALMFAQASQAQSQDFGDYVVHFNAFPSSFLTPQVATQFRIQRSRHRAVLNVSVLRKLMGTQGEPVSGKVTVNAVNLTGQAREVEMNEVRQGPAIYHIGTFKIHDGEVLDFTIDVKPVGAEATHTVKYRQQFFAQ
ncbi:MAG: DUF4426 domain-containing protein [Gammaproteobacteria bacterium]